MSVWSWLHAFGMYDFGMYDFGVSDFGIYDFGMYDFACTFKLSSLILLPWRHLIL